MTASAGIARRVIAAVLSVDACASASDGYLGLGPGITLETADSWIAQGHRYHLSGVKAGHRGAEYTNGAGRRRACGGAPLAVLAYIADARPVCAPHATRAGTSYVVSYATISADRLGLANLLIASAFAFAAIRADVWPQYAPDVVVKQSARRRAGLWQFRVVERSAIVLGRARQLTGQGQ
jgi:hypothetical protein